MHTTLAPTRWTRPQQLAASIYGVWVAILSVFLAVYVESPIRKDHPGQHLSLTQVQADYPGYVQGLILVGILAILYILTAYLSFRGKRGAFWSALVLYGFTGLGAIWVPLRPAAHAGMSTDTIILHAFINDGPGLILAIWMFIGLVIYGHAWAQRSSRHKVRSV